MKQFIPQIDWTPKKVVLALFGGALLVDSVSAVWGESSPVGSFFEEFVARAVYWAIIAAAFGSAIWIGLRAAEKTQSNLVGWGAGISTFLVVAMLFPILISNIPGVGWRYERLINSHSEMDY